MLLLLAASAALYFVLGDPVEAGALTIAIFVVGGISGIQSQRAERALQALRDLASPRASVIRGGKRRRIPGREVVRGDLILLAEGDRVPADAVLREATNLHVDESMLTGESVAVTKAVASGAATTSGDASAATASHAATEAEIGRAAGPVSERTVGGAAERAAASAHDQVLAGTVVTRGHGLAEVIAVGEHTRMGAIGASLRDLSVERTPLQREVDAVVRWIAVLGVALCMTMVLALGLMREDWLGGALAGLVLAMAILPEEMPMILAVFPALGAWRLARAQVLTRRPAALEALGATTVLCVDKTGTLTQNCMTIVALQAEGEVHAVGGGPLPEAVHEIVEIGVLASQRDPFDPMEVAFHRLGDSYLAHSEHLHPTWTLVREYPLTPPLFAISHVWRADDDSAWVVAAKGATETIVDLCHLSAPQRDAIDGRARALASRGLRVLAVARAYASPGPLPASQHAFEFEFVGLVGLEDPPRPGVEAAIEECRRAGIRVVMLTGDAPETAAAIARKVGIAADRVAVGSALRDADPAAFAEQVRHCDVFARVTPAQKLALVQGLRADGHVVAMTGDGVNDGPALKAADIGVAMGQRGTDVAREAAALILTEDDFPSLVTGIRLGRRMHENLRRALAYVIAVHVPIAGLSLLPVFLGWPLIFAPLHVVVLELIIDPASSIAFEAEELDPAAMRQPPRPPGSSIFSRAMVGLALVQGLVVFLACLGLHLLAQPLGHDVARTVTLIGFLAANLGLVLVNRSHTQSLLATMRAPNRPAAIVILGAAALLSAMLVAPPVRRFFHLVPLPAWLIAAALSAGLASVAWFEVFKWIRPAQAARPSAQWKGPRAAPPQPPR